VLSCKSGRGSLTFEQVEVEVQVERTVAFVYEGEISGKSRVMELVPGWFLAQRGLQLSPGYGAYDILVTVGWQVRKNLVGGPPRQRPRFNSSNNKNGDSNQQRRRL
jgi:hypothetical protein